jgi:hypothetical protein
LTANALEYARAALAERQTILLRFAALRGARTLLRTRAAARAECHCDVIGIVDQAARIFAVLANARLLEAVSVRLDVGFGRG